MNIITLTHDDVLRLLPDRNPESHKGDYGRILLLCGSRGYSGAAALAAMGALRSGAGLVYLGVPACIYQIEATKLNEPVVFPLPEHDGMLSCHALPPIRQLLPRMDAVLIGPGLGISAGTFEVLKTVLLEYNGPVIVDADGIKVLSEHKDILRRRTSPTILTPHKGEFLQIGDWYEKDPCFSASQLAKDLGVIVLLKGHHTIITDAYTGYINKTGNPGMAVGGSGDVLAGIITALVGQGIEPLLAAACGAWLHGAAGDICSKEIGQYGMLPTDMLNVLPRLMK